MAGLTEQQLIDMGAKPISIQPERTPEQTQQIIQQGIQEPEQRIVPGERIELPEDAGFIKRGVVGLGNFFGLSQAADIAAGTITEGENKKLKDQIVNEANQRISTYQQLIQNAQGRNDTARANRLTGQLVDDIQRINDLIGEDIFQAPTALQQVGAALTTASLVVPALRGGQLFRPLGSLTGKVVGGVAERAAPTLLQRGVPLAAEGAGFFGGLRAVETGDIGETAKGAALGAGLGLATPAALRGAGFVAGKTFGPAIRGLEKPMEV